MSRGPFLAQGWLTHKCFIPEDLWGSHSSLSLLESLSVAHRGQGGQVPHHTQLLPFTLPIRLVFFLQKIANPAWTSWGWARFLCLFSSFTRTEPGWRFWPARQIPQGTRDKKMSLKCQNHPWNSTRWRKLHLQEFLSGKVQMWLAKGCFRCVWGKGQDHRAAPEALLAASCLPGIGSR